MCIRDRYKGDIYKVKNLRNQTLRMQFPDDKAYKHAQDSIERRLRQFDKGLWVPSREELQAQKEAREKAEREAGGADEEETTAAEEQKSVKKSTTKRGAKSTKKATATVKKEKKQKVAKVKTRTVKSSGGAVRSVRNRKR